MSAYSTINISVTAARRYLMNRLMDATDEELSTILDSYLAERLYNCRIVRDGSPDAQDEIID